MGRWAATLLQDDFGHRVHDALAMFKPANVDMNNDPKYYGFLSHDGRYVIQKENTAAGTFHYYAGITGYTTAWTNRASLEYVIYPLIFNL